MIAGLLRMASAGQRTDPRSIRTGRASSSQRLQAARRDLSLPVLIAKLDRLDCSAPSHEEHKAMRRWAGRAFHPDKFDLQVTDKAIKTACRRARGDYLFGC